MSTDVQTPSTTTPTTPNPTTTAAATATTATTTGTTTVPSRHRDGERPTALLQTWSLTMLVFGIAIAAVPWVRIDLFSWIARGDTGFTTGFSEDARDYLAFNQSLMGALTAGLGMAAFWFARVPIARREAWGWHAFASSIGGWFVVDNVASVATGYPRNMVLNLVLVAPLLPLLWTTRPRR